MMSKCLLFVGYFYLFSCGFSTQNLNSDDNSLMQLPSFDARPCSVDDEIDHERTVVLNLKSARKVWAGTSVLESTAQDLNRIQTLHNRIAEMYKKRLPISSNPPQGPILPPWAPPQEYYISGILGLGRGKLSFSSQLRLSNSTTPITVKEKPVDTFYYVEIKSVVVGGEVLDIPQDMWIVSSDGSGGTNIDSGTRLTYFADPAYKVIKEAFVEKVNDGYLVVKDFPVMDIFYNVSGVDKLELPSFGLVLRDGAVWEFPIEKENVVCLAILVTPRSSLSIIGNYQQQQNFHILV